MPSVLDRLSFGRKPRRLPARRCAALGLRIEWTLEPVRHIQAGTVSGRGHGFRRRGRSGSTPTEEEHRSVPVLDLARQHAHEIRILLHARKDLPLQQRRFAPQRCQIRDADIIPLGIRAHVDKLRIGATGSSAGACSSLWLAFHPDMADSKSSDPVAREPTRLWCAAVVKAQTTLDPKQMKEWTPNSRYGGHAFGFTGDAAKKLSQFDEFLANRFGRAYSADVGTTAAEAVAMRGAS